MSTKPGQLHSQISLGEWEAFIDARSSGAIDARGRPVEKKRRPVRARTVEADLKGLKWVLNWATKCRDREGRCLLEANPVRGFDIPTEKNPRRPVATGDRCEAIRPKTDEVTMAVRWNGRSEVHRSYLSEIFDIANGTGRRLSAVCQLRYEDIRLDRTRVAPHGAIRWPADTSPPWPQHPSPGGASAPSPTFGGRRATRSLSAARARPSPPPPEAGPETVQRAYQQTDQETLLEVGLDQHRLREVR